MLQFDKYRRETDVQNILSAFTPLPLNPDIYCQNMHSEDGPITMSSFMVLSEPNNDYAFHVFKTTGSDCLEDSARKISQKKKVYIFGRK